MNTPSCKFCPENQCLEFRARVINGKTYYMKICRACEAQQSREYYALHKEERAQYQKSYIESNREIIKEKKKEYDQNRYDLNKDQILERSKTYAQNNRDKINSSKKDRRKNDPVYKLRYYISNRICKILKRTDNKKNGSCLKHLNYSFQELQSHIENLFEPWMTWSNHGNYNLKTWNDNDQSTWTWQLDHIIPQSDLPYTSMQDENFKKCWALNNLRPLSAACNVIDGTSRKRHAK